MIVRERKILMIPKILLPNGHGSENRVHFDQKTDLINVYKNNKFILLKVAMIDELIVHKFYYHHLFY